MFGNQDELIKSLPTKMTINIVGNNHISEFLISNCLDISEGDYREKIRAVTFSNIDDMILSTKINTPPSGNKENEIYGLLNLQWIKKISSTRPGTIILTYDIKLKGDNVSWKEYENSIYIDITKCKKIEKSEFINVVVIIITNSSSFNFESINDEKDKFYSIKKLLEPKNLFYINGMDNMKNISKKLSLHFLNITISFYRQLKKKLKSRLDTTKDYKEFVIKGNIKLGILSMIKNKKKSCKYFETAYANLIDLSEKIKNYVYGSDIKMNYFEIKAVADWLYFNILLIKLKEKKHFMSFINNFNIHFQFFSKLDYFNSNLIEDKKSNIFDKFLIVEYYWKIIRLEGFAKLLEDNFGNSTDKEDIASKNNLNFPGYFNILAAYNIKRLQKILGDTIKNIEDYKGNYGTNKIIIYDSKFFGRQYKVFAQIDPLTEKQIEFDEIFHIKNFIEENKVSKNILSKRLVENLSKAEKLYRNFYLDKKEINQSTMAIYFNILSMIELDDFKILKKKDEINYINPEEYSAEKEELENLKLLKSMFRSFMSNSILFKFKNLYEKFLNNYTELLKLESIVCKHRENNEQILTNLISVSSLRMLSENEQNLFHSLISDEKYSEPDKPLKQKFNLKKKNSLIKFDYEISNHNPMIFDIFETNYYLTSELDREIKLKTINIIYNNQDRNKNYFDCEYELSKNKPLNLKNVFQVKESDNNLILKAIRCELQTNNNNIIFIEMQIRQDRDKTIIVKQMENQVIEFNYKKNIQIGLEQFHKFEMEIIRKDKNISIENLNLNFKVFDKEFKEHFGRTSLIGNNPTKNINTRSNSLNEKFKEPEKENINQRNTINFFEHNNNQNIEGTINNEIILKEFDENNNITYKNMKDNCTFKFSQVEEKEICEFLIKFNDKGNYFIILEADYKIIKKEIVDDFSILKHAGEISVEVVNSFNTKFEIYSSSYMSLQKIKILPAGKNIKLNLNIINELKEDFFIEKINLSSKNENLKISSVFVDLLNKKNNEESNLDNANKPNLDSIFLFKQQTEFIIPIVFNSLNPYAGYLGNLEIFYSTKSLKDFNPLLFNKINFAIPEYNIKIFDVDLSYSIPKDITNKEKFDFKIQIKNQGEEPKRFMLLIDNTQYFIVNGRVKEKICLNSNQNVEKIFNIIPLNFGRLKLPAFKISEFPYESTTYDNKIYSIYYLPDNIHIN